MKITVFGATGRTGREVVRLALDRGYKVVAFVRDSRKVTIENSQLEVVQGELSDKETLRTALKGVDCVISALGPAGKPSDEELSIGIANILSVMEEYGVKRFIALSTTSNQDPLDQDGFRFRMRRNMIRRGRPLTYEQIVKYSQLVRDSNTDWTLIRIASLLTDKPLSKHVRAGYLGKDKLGAKLSRTDLAWFMLEQVNGTDYIRKAPAVSN